MGKLNGELIWRDSSENVIYKQVYKGGELIDSKIYDGFKK